MTQLVLGRGLDADEIVPGLWQGAKPPRGAELSNRGFQVLVLCAEEYQPSSALFPGVHVIRAPNDDNYLRDPTVQEVFIAWRASKKAFDFLVAGAHVLVTCMAGRNRSGLVSAMVLRRMGFSKKGAIGMVQNRRPTALQNPGFLRVVNALP